MAKAKADAAAGGLTFFKVAGSNPVQRVALKLEGADAIIENGKGSYRVHVGGVMHIIETKATLEELTGGGPLELDVAPE